MRRLLLIIPLVVGALHFSAPPAEAQLRWRASYSSSMPVYRGSGLAARSDLEIERTPRGERVPINPLLLRRDRPDVYRLGPGDVLGVFIDGVLGERDGQIPVHFPEDGQNEPSTGYPIPVRDDGVISLPLVPDIAVAGLSVAEAEAEIRRVFIEQEQILQPQRDRILVSLMRKRVVRVLVIREDTGAAGPQMGYVTKRGNAATISLPADENDVLHVLAETGGLPGLDARNEVTIYRGSNRGGASPGNSIDERWGARPSTGPSQQASSQTIPLRASPRMPPRHSQRDITLSEGDVVHIESRDNERYYTGGTLPGGEHLLPRDRDLTMLQALAASGGLTHRTGELFPPRRATLLRGGVPITLDTRRAMLGGGGPYVQPGDLVILNYTPGAAVGNYLGSQINLQFLLNNLGR